MRQVLWLGGSAGSGKTSIARRRARRHGLRWYSSDARTWAHRDRALAAGNPAAVRWEAMSPEARWTTLAPAEMLELSLHAERGQMIVDDLRQLPTTPLIVAEGTPVSPEVISAGLAERSHAVWLLPTPEFARARLRERGRAPGPAQLSLLLAETIAQDVRAHGAPTLTVDGSRGLREMTDAVEEHFAGALAAGPRAASLNERRALLREANAAIEAQVRAYYARPWADGDADSVVRTFVCECGTPDCEASVELPLRALAGESPLAPGHG